MKLFELLAAIAIAAALTACSATRSTPAPEIAIQFACETYGAGGTYDSTRDTRQTTKDVQNKNARFAGIGCDLATGTVK